LAQIANVPSCTCRPFSAWPEICHELPLFENAVIDEAPTNTERMQGGALGRQVLLLC
jgi:hypothetical protein